MGDPLSIFSATATAITICGNVLQYANDFRTAGEDFQSLTKQTQSLSEVLDALYAEFKQPLVNKKIKSSQDIDQRYGHEGTYWRSVKQSMDDCRETLQKLQRILSTSKSGGLMNRVFKRVKLVMQKDEIEKYWQEITFYRETMKFALQWITLYVYSRFGSDKMFRSSGMKSEELNEQVASKLDRMMLKINSVRERLDHQRQSPMPHMGTPSLDNLRSCVQNAYELASCASKSVRDGRITQWMSSINPNGDDQSVSIFIHSLQILSSNAARPENQRRSTITSTVSQSKSRILCWYDSGKSDFQARKYKGAWTFLDKAYSELETTHSELQDRALHFNNWDSLLNLLVVCQCKLQKFDEALGTLDSLIQRMGSELVSETLLNAVCKTTEVLISNFCTVERLDDAVSLATKVIDLKTSNNLSALDTQRLLAEVYLRKNNLEKAESRYLEIIAARDSDERASIDDETDLLLFLIYSQTGNMGETICKRELLSESYKSIKALL